MTVLQELVVGLINKGAEALVNDTSVELGEVECGDHVDPVFLDKVADFEHLIVCGEDLLSLRCNHSVELVAEVVAGGLLVETTDVSGG